MTEPAPTNDPGARLLPPRVTRRRLLAAAAASVAGLAAGATLYWRRSHAAERRDGAAVLALELPDVDGHVTSLAQWRGKVMFVNFWATWCGPCREEMPQFVATQARDGAKGVQFVGIAVDQVDKVRQFSKEFNINYPLLIGGFGAIELSKALGNDLAALPFTIVLDRQGNVAHTQLGPLKAPALDALIQSLAA
ncbi:MAG: TlpA disulfide reductase family protein [Betaproteobacteria bacterium]